MNYEAGQIVLVDWRDALPKEANKRRPAVVVEDSDLFAPTPSRITGAQLAEIRRLIGIAIGLD